MILPLDTEARAEHFLEWAIDEGIHCVRAVPTHGNSEFAVVHYPEGQISTMYRVRHQETGEWAVAFTPGLKGLVKSYCAMVARRRRRRCMR